VAACVAFSWPAETLVLVKSAALPPGAPASAAAAGLVDVHFPQVAGSIARLGWVNLRADRPTIETWRGG
jgi:hypothetical protein